MSTLRHGQIYYSAITAPSRRPSVIETGRAPAVAKGVFMRRKLSLEQKWREQADAFRREAEKLPYGKEREELLRLASQLETASHINEWVSSPGLSPPK
jgi:hypothetical protein